MYFGGRGYMNPGVTDVCYIELLVMRSVHKDTIGPCSLLSSDRIISCY